MVHFPYLAWKARRPAVNRFCQGHWASNTATARLAQSMQMLVVAESWSGSSPTWTTAVTRLSQWLHSSNAHAAFTDVPGPLFSFAAYLGASMGRANGVLGAALCLVAIYLPSFLLIVGVLPFWSMLRRQPLARAALRGVNASVVGLLIAALYRPVWTAGVLNAGDYAVAVAAFLLLFLWRSPPWLVVLSGALAGAAMETR